MYSYLKIIITGDTVYAGAKGLLTGYTVINDHPHAMIILSDVPDGAATGIRQGDIVAVDYHNVKSESLWIPEEN